MTRQENILTLNEHLDHWKRLLSEKICDQSGGEKTIDALQNAIKALEQEPFINKPCVSEKVCEQDKQMVLDKIRAEIEALPKTYPFVNHYDMYVKEDDVKKIIDKYIAEGSEE